MTFDLKAARARCEKATPGPWIDSDGYIICPGMEIRNCKAHDLIFIMESRSTLPAALDEIERLQNREKWLLEDNEKRAVAQKEQATRISELESENERLAKMFADDCYIESAHMEPGYYNINTRGKGAMLLAGQLIRFFRESSKGNFITCTFQMGFGDPKTLEQFELTIQKINGEDTPGQKIQRQQEQIEALKTTLIEERARREHAELWISTARDNSPGLVHLPEKIWVDLPEDAKTVHKPDDRGRLQAEGTIDNIDLSPNQRTNIVQDSGAQIGGQIALTAEQRAALEYAISSLEQCDSEPEDPICVMMLKAMLAQSRPAWQITKERKEALETLLECMNALEFRYAEAQADVDEKSMVLRDMLADAEGRP